MFKFFKVLGAARDGDKMLRLYERALNAANRYLPIKLGPGNAKLASAVLNEILGENVFKGSGVENFHAQNKDTIEQKAKGILADDLLLCELMIRTLWAKWTLDKAFDRNPSVPVEACWAYNLYSSNYPLLPLKEYEALIGKFEDQTATELGKYLESHSTAKG